MEVTRTSLSSYKDPSSNIPKQVRYEGASTTGKYGERIREDLRDIKPVKREAPIIKATKVEGAVSDPKEYTKDAVKTAIEKLKKLALQAGLADDPTDATVAPQTPSTGGGGGGGGGGNNFFTNLTNDQIGMLSTQQLVDRDNLMYGNTFPLGSFSATDTLSMVRRDNLKYGDTFPEGSFNITKPKEEKSSMGTTFTGIGTKEFTKAQKEKEKKQPKQTVAALPSDYKKTEKAAFDKAKSWQDSKKKGQAATKATGIPTKPKAGSFGISEAGKKQAEANKKKKQAEAKKKAEAAKKKQTESSKPSSFGSKKSSRGSSGRKSSSSSKSSSSKKSSSGSKSTSGSKRSSRGASGSSSSRSRGGTGSGRTSTSRSASSASRSRTGRSRTRCDIKCKIDISKLTNLNLIRDDLAHIAYFVKELQEE